MASYRLTLATIKGAPGTKTIGELLMSFGMPEKEEFGVLSHDASDVHLTASIVRKTLVTVAKIDPATKEVVSERIEKATVIPFAIWPSQCRLEIYAGARKNIEEIGIFLSSCLGLAVVVESRELDVASAVEKLSKQSRFQLKSVKVSDFAKDSYMIGPYGPKFQDTEHGTGFLAEYAAAVTAATVKFQAPHGPATVTIRPNACLSFSCNEEDPQAVKNILRELV